MYGFPYANLLALNERSSTPKYRQVADAVIAAIKREKLEVDDVLPSSCALSAMLGISKDTVEKGYQQLKKMGVVDSVHGKGRYIASTGIGGKKKLVFLSNTLDPSVCNSFLQVIGTDYLVDFKVYNNDFSILKKRLETCLDKYDCYVLTLHTTEVPVEVRSLLNELLRKKVVLLDKKISGLRGSHCGVFSDFERDVFAAFEEAMPRLQKYHSIYLIHPETLLVEYSQEIEQGIRQFCNHYRFTYRTSKGIAAEEIEAGTVYITLAEEDLVSLVQHVKSARYETGRQVGLISLNEAPLKKLIFNGVTTLSVEHKTFGEKAARFIAARKMEESKAGVRLNLRQSL